MHRSVTTGGIFCARKSCVVLSGYRLCGLYIPAMTVDLFAVLWVIITTAVSAMEGRLNYWNYHCSVFMVGPWNEIE